MLPGPARLRRRSEFQTAVRVGRRGATRALTLHLATGHPAAESGAGSIRVGFVVPRAVGTAVVRNQVRRRLRHLLRDRLERLPGDSLLVVRVAPSAARLSSTGLAAALDEALRRVTHDRATAGRDISRVLA
ncbi:MAG TPA: ribonuclease P protein component [Mycobacteriales bacterium]|nr:ribonuclease P protein component [Mycobacteriales bacterium]